VTDKQWRWLWIVAGLYLAVVAAVVLRLAPIWCLNVVLAFPLALRLLRQAREDADVMPGAAEFIAVFVGQVVLGYVIKGIVR
jgi:1,4-dihydroxy-2-naphthoate octaprenyltransferase